MKGVMVRARFINIKAIDAPTCYFFNLEKTVCERKQMTCLRLSDGKITTNLLQMRKRAVASIRTYVKQKNVMNIQ